MFYKRIALVLLCMLSVGTNTLYGAAQNNWQPLITAIETGDLATVKRIVPAYIHPLERTGFGMNKNPLEMATYHATHVGAGQRPDLNGVLAYIHQAATCERQPVRGQLARSPQEQEEDDLKAALALSMREARPSIVRPQQGGRQGQQQPLPAAQQQAQRPAQFSILSTNVLNEGAYQFGFNSPAINALRAGNSRSNRQDIYQTYAQQYGNLGIFNKRKAAFAQTIAQLKPDIFAAQEYRTGGKPIDSSPNLIADVSANEHANYHWITDGGPEKFGNDLFLGALKSKFNLVKADHAPFAIAPKRSFVALILQPKGEQKLLGVINTHLDGGPNSREGQLQDILQYISANAQIQQWILCGDFNWDWVGGASAADSWITHHGFNLAETSVTTFNPQKGHEKKDYLLYRGLPQPIQAGVIPHDTNAWLTHSPADGNLEKSHYSDHAAIFAVFPLEHRPSGYSNNPQHYQVAIDFIHDGSAREAAHAIETLNLDLSKIIIPAANQDLRDLIIQKAFSSEENIKNFKAHFPRLID